MRIIFKTSSVTPDFFYVFNLILSFSTCSESFEKICTWELLGANVLNEARLPYIELFWPRTKPFSKWRKPENKSHKNTKNTKEIIIKHKGTKMILDGKDDTGQKRRTWNI